MLEEGVTAAGAVTAAAGGSQISSSMSTFFFAAPRRGHLKLPRWCSFFSVTTVVAASAPRCRRGHGRHSLLASSLTFKCSGEPLEPSSNLRCYPLEKCREHKITPHLYGAF